MALIPNALVQLSEAKSFLGYKDSDESLEFLINAVTQYIENYCGRTFKETDYEEIADGQHAYELVMRNYPITDVSSVEERTTNDNSESWNTLEPEEYWYESDTGLVIKNTPFYKGVQNYRVTYSAGFTPIPFDLQYTALSLIKEMITVKQSGGIKQESLGDHSLTFESIVRTSPMLKDTLDGYRSLTIA